MDASQAPAVVPGRARLARYAVHAVLSLAVAVLVWHQGLPWLTTDPEDVQRYLPLGFAVLTALVLALATKLDGRALSIVLGLDLLGWIALPGAIVATHISPIWYGGWLTGAVVVKLLPFGVGLFVAVRSGLADRTAALAVSAMFLVSSLVMLPYTRYRVPGSNQITGDEPHYLTVTANLLAGGGFWVGKAYTNGLFARVYGASIPFSQWRLETGRTVSGHYGPGHDLGLSLLAVPFYALGGTTGVFVAIAFIASLTVYEIYRLLRALPVAPTVALTVTLIAAFSLPFLVFATNVAAEVPLACCVAIVARRLFSRSRSRVDIVVVAIALAAMPWLHVRGWPLVIPLLLGALLTWRSRFAWVVLIGILIISTAAYWSLLYSIYGRFVIAPVSLLPGLHLQLSALSPALVMLCMEFLLVDPASGLLPNAPIWLLGLAGLFLLARRSVAGAAATGAVVFYVLVVGVSTLGGANPGWGPPGRFAVVLVPLLAPALALAWQRMKGRWWSEIRWPLLAWTALCVFGVQAVRTTAYPPGIVTALLRFLGAPVPTLYAPRMPWVFFGVLVVLLALTAVAIHAAANPAGDLELTSSSPQAREPPSTMGNEPVGDHQKV